MDSDEQRLRARLSTVARPARRDPCGIASTRLRRRRRLCSCQRPRPRARPRPRPRRVGRELVATSMARHSRSDDQQAGVSRYGSHAPIASTDRPDRSPGPIPEGSTRLAWSVHNGRTTLPLDDLTIIGSGGLTTCWHGHLILMACERFCAWSALRAIAFDVGRLRNGSASVGRDSARRELHCSLPCCTCHYVFLCDDMS